MNAQVLAAIATAIASLLVAAAGLVAARRTGRELERLKAELAERTAARNAKLAYEFEARKRLYHECGPLLFQLSEFAERALGRITGLARTAAEGKLDPGPSWLRRGYYSRSTYYRLLAPLAVGRLLQKRLTHLDLSLEPVIHWQYALVKQIADSFTDDFDLAGKATSDLPIDGKERLDYDPHNAEAETLRRDDPAKYWQQGIPRGILDNAIDSLLQRDTDGTLQVLEFREFEERMQDAASPVGKCFARISYLFAEFHPRTRPVLWRILVAQAHLYRALLAARQIDHVNPDVWTNLWAGDTTPLFDWRTSAECDRAAAESVDSAVRIAASYTRRTTEPVLTRLTAVPV
jgi:hypothetical protein